MIHIMEPFSSICYSNMTVITPLYIKQKEKERDRLDVCYVRNTINGTTAQVKYNQLLFLEQVGEKHTVC